MTSLVKIGAKVVRHGRYVTFQLAEVAIPRRLFAEILQLIDGPRPKPVLRPQCCQESNLPFTKNARDNLRTSWPRPLPLNDVQTFGYSQLKYHNSVVRDFSTLAGLPRTTVTRDADENRPVTRPDVVG